MHNVVAKARELEALFEAVEVAPWLIQAKLEIFKDYQHVLKAIEDLKTCDSDFRPVDGDDYHLRRDHV